MGVKIDDHKTFVAIPYLHVMSNESYIRVDAKTTSSVCMRMVKASTKVNRPSFMVGDTCSLNWTESMSLKLIKQFPSQDPARQKAERHFNNSTNWNCIVKFKKIPQRHYILQEFSVWDCGFLKHHWGIYYFFLFKLRPCTLVFDWIERMKFFNAAESHIIIRVVNYWCAIA